jgi:hypothetical protein
MRTGTPNETWARFNLREVCGGVTGHGNSVIFLAEGG